MGRFQSIYTALSHSAGGILGSDVDAFLHNDEARFRLPALESLQKFSLEDVKNWMQTPLKSGYLELTIVGDIDPERALELVGKTLGALPERAAEKPRFEDKRQVKFPATPKSKEFKFASDTPIALSVVCWPTPGSRSSSLANRMNLLANIFQNRLFLKVREEIGATYTPSMDSVTRGVYPDYGYLQSVIELDPARLAEVNRLVVEMGENLATGGVTEDEFQRAFKPAIASLDTMVLQNGYWMLVLCDCQENPSTLDDARNLVKDYQSITKAEIEALAKQLLSADKATVISVVPTRGSGK